MRCISVLLADLKTGSAYQLIWTSLVWLLATVLLVLAWRSRWVKPRPLLRYVLLSVYCHVLLAVYASTVLWLPAPAYNPAKRVRLELVELAQAEPVSEELAQPAPAELDLHTGAESPPWAQSTPDDSPSEPATSEPTQSQDETSAVRSEDTLPPTVETHDLESSPPAPTEMQVSADTESPAAHDAQAQNDSPSTPQPTLPTTETVDGTVPLDEQAQSEANRLSAPNQTEYASQESVAQSESQVDLDEMRQGDAQPSAEHPGQPSDPHGAPVGTTAATDWAATNDNQQTNATTWAASPSGTSGRGHRLDGQPVPMVYRNRFLANRVHLVERLGGSERTEQAVARALRWLAANQAPDGRWPARLHGAGEERWVLGQFRNGAGGDADTGVTGLALLAFLGAGHTHIEGQYCQNVRQAASFLMQQQSADGNLAGATGTYAAMYCHAISFLALTELYALTGDVQLRPVIDRAHRYTLSAQSPHDGGWRYRPRDPQGDTSQFGWQLLALKSAEISGWTIPPANRSAMEYFLTTVSSGRYGGLASYRASMAATPAMTAEAMVCRHLLGVARSQEQQDEAASLIMSYLPNRRPANFYYWYYASLALFLTHHRLWPTWNQQVTTELLQLQVDNGPHAGSWNTDTVWGGYGGRVYTTSMAVLCLEVYYRFDRDVSVDQTAGLREAEVSRGLLPR